MVAVAGGVAPGPSAAAGGVFTSWLTGGTGTQCSTPPACGDGGPATAANLSFPQAVAVGPEGSVYVADWGDNEIRRISVDGVVTAVAGTGTACRIPPSCGDGAAGTDAHLNFPEGVAVDPRNGNVYIADTLDNEIRQVTPQGTIKRVAGTGATCAKPPMCGDGGSATSAILTSPGGVAVDRQGNLYIADTGDNEIRLVSPRGVISRVAGNGNACVKAGACGDGGPATSAQLRFPQALALDNAGGMYVADDGDNKVRKVSTSGNIDTVAGTGAECSSAPSCGDGGPAKQAELTFPTGVAVDAAGIVYIADQGDDKIRQLAGTTITTIAGTGSECAKPPVCGDGGPAIAATFDYPTGVAVDSAGNMLVADAIDHEVRWLSSPARPPARITTLVGKVSLLAFSAGTAQDAVTVRGALSAAARLTLTVSGGGHGATLVARGNGRTGFFALRWNRKFGNANAVPGTYRLTVTGTISGHSATSQLRVRLS